VDVDGPERQQGRLAQDNKRIRDGDIDSTTAVCSQSNISASDNEQPNRQDRMML